MWYSGVREAERERERERVREKDEIFYFREGENEERRDSEILEGICVFLFYVTWVADL